MTYDAAVSKASIEAIWSLWTRRAGAAPIPGHDLPMVQHEGEPRYLGRREAGIRAWYGEDLDETRVFSLLPESGSMRNPRPPDALLACRCGLPPESAAVAFAPPRRPAIDIR